ncbi:MAG: HD domain-containing phosphohydrolase [Actinomycetota bacterium]|nr:HD domain-containing protein [Actinomycetota bacterium]
MAKRSQVPQKATAAPPHASGTRLSELVAAISLSSDLALGQPMEHVLRATLIAIRMAQRLDLDEDARAETYWVTLLATVCTGESFELMEIFGDDIAFRSGAFHVGPSQLSQMFYMLGRAGSGRPPPARLRAAAGIVMSAGKNVEASFVAHCAVTTEISRRIGLPPGVGEALPYTFARWDGKGIPRGVASDAIPMSARLMQLADYIEVSHRIHGVDGAISRAEEISGTMLSPAIVKVFSQHAHEILGNLEESTWDQVVAAEPRPRPPLTEDEFDAVLEVMADISDLKSPWFSGHSRGVADLAARAVKAAGMPERDVVTTRRAGLVHDLGRTAVSNSVWDKREALTQGERERVRLHAYYTERMLRRPGALAGLAAVASSDHERLDGSGYHRAIRGSDIPLLGRYLAAADVYHAMLEDRPYRPALKAGDAAAQLRAEARRGALDAAAVDIVLGVAGHKTSGPPSAPAGLTPREVEVLILIARGATTRHVASVLGIKPKTAGNHVERIYTKIGATSRSTATLFAMQHGMLATLEPVQH